MQKLPLNGGGMHGVVLGHSGVSPPPFTLRRAFADARKSLFRSRWHLKFCRINVAACHCKLLPQAHKRFRPSSD